MKATDVVLSIDPALYETVHFASRDGLTITADLYRAKSTKGWVVLCHQGFCNRGEYRPVAPRLARLGYSCLAIDQRSGMTIFGVTNETSALAKKRGLKTGYVDSKPDVEAAIQYVNDRRKGLPLVLVGSSYSASLALLIGSDQTQTSVEAVAAFSPDEYLKKIHLAASIRGLVRPTFVTSAKQEIGAVTKLLRFVDPKVISRFRPRSGGLHGARSLWSTTPGHEGYWAAFETFLATIER